MHSLRVMVTGASRGIGCGIALQLAHHGCAVGALARSEDQLEALQHQIEGAGQRCAVAAADLREPAAVERGIGQLCEALGGVDALINNAGAVIRKDAFTLSLDEWHTMIETNVNGLFYATRAVLGPMREQGHGHIINVSSISGKLPLAGGSGYAASKYACTGFSQSLFLEARPHGIKVTTIFPGSVDSGSHRHDAQADHSWKVRPEEVGRVCWDVLNTRRENLIAEVEIRPLIRPSGA